jgi:acrylyl-CoA reductase (NADPH)
MISVQQKLLIESFFLNNPSTCQRTVGRGDRYFSWLNTLANVLSQLKYGGAVAACGLAESMSLPTSVVPFILRGVTLYGIDSVMTSLTKSLKAWQRIVKALDLAKLESLSSEITMEELPAVATAIMAGAVSGRTVVVFP